MRFLVFIVALLPVATADVAALNDMLKKMEDYVVELAQKVEALYENRCNTSFDSCDSNNYESCRSALPNQTCITSDVFTHDQCENCGTFFDYTVSTVSAQELYPRNAQIIENICFSQTLDDWFRQKKKNDTSYWEDLGLEPPHLYYGSKDGTMRIYPGRRRNECNYDPRERPWYIAASSGPKNVILLLDTSSSMGQGDLLDSLKNATYRIIDSLSDTDRVAIVRFYGDIEAITDDNLMYIATKKNKDHLKEVIENFMVDSGTNFYDAFDAAFDIMNISVANGRAVGCNSAILFFTDGEMTAPDGKNVSDVIKLVTRGLESTSTMTGHPVLLFTYSISNDDNVHLFPRQLACQTKYGVWSKITNSSGLLESLTSYYTLLAFGLGGNQNKYSVTWVEPYLLKTRGMGTTVSVPVYNRKVQRPLPFGVVGVDHTIAAMDKVLGVTEGSIEVLTQFRESESKCPFLNLTDCVLESFRQQGSAGDDALCGTASCSNSDYVNINAETCQDVTYTFASLWTNFDNKNSTYEEKVCCPGENTTLEECPAYNSQGNDDSISPSYPPTAGPAVGPTVGSSTGSTTGPATGHDKSTNKGVIIGSVLGSVLLVAIMWWVKCRRGRGLDPYQFYPNPSLQ